MVSRLGYPSQGFQGRASMPGFQGLGPKARASKSRPQDQSSQANRYDKTADHILNLVDYFGSPSLISVLDTSALEGVVLAQILVKPKPSAGSLKSSSEVIGSGTNPRIDDR